MKEPMAFAREQAKKHGTSFEVTDDMDAACRGADIVYAKSWGIEELFHKPDEALKLSKRYRSWICDERQDEAGAQARDLHALPARPTATTR